jgi:hypothetical protein
VASSKTERHIHLTVEGDDFFSTGSTSWAGDILGPLIERHARQFAAAVNTATKKVAVAQAQALLPPQPPEFAEEQPPYWPGHVVGSP